MARPQRLRERLRSTTARLGRAGWAVVTPWRALFAAMVLIWTWYFTWLTLRIHHGLGTSSYDLGLYDQGVWLLSRLKAPFVTLMGRNLMGDHTSFILVFLAPLYRIWPSVGILLGVRLQRRLSQDTFYRVAYALLAVVGSKLLYDGLRALLGCSGVALTDTVQVLATEGQRVDGLTVALVDGSFSLRLHSWVGKRSPAHLTSMGKVGSWYLASTDDRDVLERFFKAACNALSAKHPGMARVRVLNGPDLYLTESSNERIFLPQVMQEDIEQQVLSFYASKDRYEKLGIPLRELHLVDVYTIATSKRDFSPEELSQIGAQLSNPVVQRYSVDRPTEADFDHAIEVGFLPGVTDNVGATARQTIEDYFGFQFGKGEAVFSSQLYLAAGGDKNGGFGAQAVEFRNNARVPQAHVAFVTLVGIEGGCEERRENLVAAGMANAQVKGGAFEIGSWHLGNILGDAVESRIALAQQGAAGMIHEAAEGQGADVIDPLDRRFGGGDHVFAMFVVKVPVVHTALLLTILTNSGCTTLLSASTNPKSICL